jgi:hypothetical protein
MVFGCTCFVRDHRPSVGKLDPSGQKKAISVGFLVNGEHLWAWIWRIEPFYGDNTDLNSLFDFDSPNTSDASRDGESGLLRTREDEPSRFMVDLVPPPASEEGWRKPNDEQNLKVYTRRQPKKWAMEKTKGGRKFKVYMRRQSQNHQREVQTNGEI